MQPRLSKSDIRLLCQLIKEEPSTASELNDKTGLAKETTSRELALLSELGFIQWTRRGRAKYFQLSDNRHARLLRNMLVQSPHLRYEEILTGKSLDVLAAVHLLHLSSIKEIEEYSQTSHVKVIELLAMYRHLGVVRKSQGRYRLGVRYGLLGDLLEEFRSYTNLRMLRNEVHDAVVVWERDRDILFRSSSKSEVPFPASVFSAFPRFGVDLLLGNGDYFFHSPRNVKIGPEEALVHAMLAAETPRERMLILLLMMKATVDEKRVLSLSRIYKSANTARDFLEYVKTRGAQRPMGFPEWQELSRRMREYE